MESIIGDPGGILNVPFEGVQEEEPLYRHNAGGAAFCLPGKGCMSWTGKVQGNSFHRHENNW
jgi:hypothetical protein